MQSISRRGMLTLPLLASRPLANLAFGAAGKARPNILFIMSDDHASQAMSCYGSRVNQTPNLDRIANEGMRMDRVFATNSICTPSRATILTGKYSHMNGVPVFNRFDGSQPTVSKMLQRAGYYTGHDRQMALGQRPHGIRLLEYSSRPGRLQRSDVLRPRGLHCLQGLRHGHHRGSHDRQLEKPADGQAVLHDVATTRRRIANGSRTKSTASSSRAGTFRNRRHCATITPAVPTRFMSRSSRCSGI